MEYNVDYMKVFIVIVSLCFALDFIFLPLIGVLRHFKNYYFPMIQKIVICMMCLAFMYEFFEIIIFNY